jgi:hypothetical protein
VTPGNIERAVELAREAVATATEPRRLSRLAVDASGLPAGFFEGKVAEAARRRPGHPAPGAIVKALEAAAHQSYEAGASIEARLFEELRASTESKALRHLFFAQREAAKIPGRRPHSRAYHFEPGQQLRLTVAGWNVRGAGLDLESLEAGPLRMGRQAAMTPHADNHGTHIIHSGRDRLSYIKIPVVDSPE